MLHHREEFISWVTFLSLELSAIVCVLGSVDAFAAVLGARASHNQDITTNEIFIFDVVNVNIRGEYNSTTGRLTEFSELLPGHRQLQYSQHNILYLYQESSLSALLGSIRSECLCLLPMQVKGN